MGLLGGFSNPILEARFREYQYNQLAANGDVAACLCFACTWAVCALYLAFKYSTPLVGLEFAAWNMAVWLLIWPLAHVAPNTYRRHRRLLVIAQRLACVFLLPSLADLAPHFSPGVRITPSLGPILSTVVFNSQIITTWALALGLLLDFRAHLLPAVLAAWHISLHQAPALCALPYAANPVSQQGFHSMAQRLAQQAGRLLPPLDRFMQILESEEAFAGLHCRTFSAAAQLVFGFLLPTLAVYAAEQRSRKAFLGLAAAEAGVELADAGELLGISRRELWEVCLFDDVLLWVRFLALLPLVAAGAWLAVLTLLAQWEAGQPGGWARP